MNASDYLRKQGWRGTGFSLDHGGHGLARPVLIAHKTDQLGLGVQKTDFRSQWWNSDFDKTLEKLGTKTSTAESRPLDRRLVDGLYSRFVKADALISEFRTTIPPSAAYARQVTSTVTVELRTKATTNDTELAKDLVLTKPTLRSSANFDQASHKRPNRKHSATNSQDNNRTTNELDFSSSSEVDAAFENTDSHALDQSISVASDTMEENEHVSKNARASCRPRKHEMRRKSQGRLHTTQHAKNIVDDDQNTLRTFSLIKNTEAPDPVTRGPDLALGMSQPSDLYDTKMTKLTTNAPNRPSYNNITSVEPLPNVVAAQLNGQKTEAHQPSLKKLSSKALKYKVQKAKREAKRSARRAMEAHDSSISSHLQERQIQVGENAAEKKIELSAETIRTCRTNSSRKERIKERKAIKKKRKRDKQKSKSGAGKDNIID